MKASRNLLPLLILVVVIIFVFKDLPKTFYQQDEWNGLGLVFAQGARTIFNGITELLDLVFVKGRVLSNLIYYLFLHYFPFQNSQMAIFAVFLHIITTYLVFILIEKVIHKSFISFLGALFFAVNAVSHGAVTWSFVAISAVGSTILILLGTIFFFNFLSNSRKRWLLLTGVMIYLSLWFKETGLYMFLFLPFITLLFKQYSLKSFLKTFWIFVVPFLFIVSYRVLELKLRHTTSNLYITGLNENFFSTIFFRAFLYPLTSFSLMFVPGDQFLSFAREVQDEVYPFLATASNNILIAQTVVLDFLAVILTFVILIFIYLLWQKERLENKKFVVFWILFSFMSFLPYVLLSKDFSYLESRYYYVSVVGVAFLLSWVINRLCMVLNKTIFFGLVAPLCLAYIFLHAFVVHAAIEDQIVLSNIRKNFISQLRVQVPKLENSKNVFYTTSDKNYWVDTNMLPFQQGSGYTLMVLYYDTGKIPKEFLKDGYLFEIGSQGYKEEGDTGFGFFYDEKELDKTIKIHNLLESSIIRLNYDSIERKLNRI